MNKKLNQLGNNFSLFVWYPPMKGQNTWDNYLYIDVPPNKYKSLTVATMLQPTNSKVMGIVHVYRPNVNPDSRESYPHMYWNVENGEEYIHHSIYFPEPGTYILAVRGEKRFYVDGKMQPPGPFGDERWSGWVALLGIELASINDQTVPFDDGIAEGFTWSVDEESKVRSLSQHPEPSSQPNEPVVFQQNVFEPFVGEWFSPQYNYAFRMEGNRGLMTILNHPETQKVGDEVFRITWTDGKKFKGEHLFTDLVWHQVDGEIIFDNTMRLRGNGIEWDLNRKT